MIEINGEKLEVTIFPDKTSQVWKLSDKILNSTTINVMWEFENEAEIFHICQLKRLLDNKAKKAVVKCLHIPFLPFGRQDKTVSNESTFALSVFADLINSLNFDYVSTLDAHSNVAKFLINNLDDVFPKKQIEDTIDKFDNTSIIFPDKGAFTRYSKEVKVEEEKLLIGDKTRNQLTGYIEKYDVIGECKDKDVLIIDDICDGGMTFRLLSKELLKLGAKSVNLYVTHGIFSKGLDILREDGISRIFTHKGEIK
jgi:ribose-phosphate pyrophosphokinase